MANVPLSVAVPQIYVPSLSVGHIKTPHIYPTHITVPGASTIKKPKIVNKHITDLGDVVLGRPIQGTKQLRATLRDNDLDFLVYVPLINRLVGAGLAVKERFVEPFFKEDSFAKGAATVGINTLETIGNSLDTLANPVKSLMPWAGGGTTPDFLKSIGWIEDEYRQIYQWDTGNFIVDLAGEILSDPATVLSLGGSIGANLTTDAAMAAVKRAVVKEVGEEVAREIPEEAYELLLKELSIRLSDSSDDTARRLIKRVADNRANLRESLKGYSPALGKYKTIQNTIKNYNQLELISKNYNLGNIIHDIRQAEGYRFYRAASTLHKVGTTMDDVLLKASFASIPHLYAFKKLVYDYLYIKGFKSLWNNTTLKLNAADPKELLNNSSALVRRYKSRLIANQRLYHKDMWATWDRIVKNYNIDMEKLVQLYARLVKQYMYTGMSKAQLDAKFLDQLFMWIPSLKQHLSNTSVLKGVTNVLDASTDPSIKAAADLFGDEYIYLADLTDVVGSTAINLVRVEEEVHNKLLKALKEDMDEFFKNRSKGIPNQISGYSALEKLQYVDRHLLKFEGDRYGLRKLPAFLDAVSKHNPAAMANYITILNYFGITVDNYMKICNLIRLKKTKKLKEVLLSSKTGSLYTDPEILSNQHKVLSKLKYHKPNLKYNLTDRDEAFIKDLQLASESIEVQINKSITSLNDFEDLSKFNNDFIKALNENLKTSYETFKETIDDTKLTMLSSDADLDISNSALFDEIVDFDMDSINSESLKEYKEAIYELRSRLTNWTMRIKNKELALDVNTEQTIFDMYNFLKQKSVDTYLVNLSDLLNLDDDVLRLISSAQNRFAIIQLMLQSDPAVDNFFKLLSNVNSRVRSNLQHVTKTLYKTNVYYNADYINDLLMKVDSTNAINNLLNTTLTAYDIPDEVHDYLQGMLFNIIYKYKNVPIVDINVDLITDEFMRQFIRDNENIVYEHFKALPNRAYGPDAILVDFEEDLQVAVKQAFTEYIEILHIAGNLNNKLPTMYQYFDGTSIAYATTLGLNIDEILTALNSQDVSEAVIDDTTKFIKSLTGSQVDTDMLKYTQALLDNDFIEFDLFSKKGDSLSKHIDNLIEIAEANNKQLVESTLVNQLREAFKHIDELDTYLGGGKTVLGKSYFSDSGPRTLKAYTKYITTHRINEFIRRQSNYVNTYAFSTANRFIGFKKDVSLDFLSTHRITKDSVRYPKSSEPMKFYQLYNAAYNRIKDRAIYNREHVARARKALADVYSDPTLKFGPKKPEAYFRGYLNSDGIYIPGIPDVEVLTWDAITRSSSLDATAAYRYKKTMNKYYRAEDLTKTYSERVNYYSNPNAVLTDIENVTVNKLIADPNDFADLYEKIPTDFLDDLYSGISNDLQRTFKSLDALRDYEYLFATRINRDVDMLNKLRTLDTFRKNEHTVGTVIKDPKVLKVLDTYGIKAETKMNSSEVLEFMFHERTQNLVESIKSWDHLQLRTWLDRNTDGSFIFVDDTGSFEFSYTPEQLKEAGLIIKPLSDDEHIFVIRRTSNKNITPVDYKYIQRSYIFSKEQNKLTNLLKQFRNYVAWDGIDLPDSLFTGQVLDINVYDTIRKHKSIADILGDEAERKLYSKVDKKGLNSFYTNKSSRPNLAIIGSPSAFNTVLALCEEDFVGTDIARYSLSQDLVASIWRGMLTSIKRVNTVSKYAQLFANADYYIGNRYFKKILTSATDEQLQELFTSYKAVVLKHNHNGSIKCYKIHIRNQKDLANAIEAKAILVPHEVYRNMLLTLNKGFVESKLINAYQRTIVGTFKTMYLHTAGFLMRNFIDSAIYKNNASYKGVQGMIDMFQYEYRAMKMLDWYDKIQRQVFELSNDNTFNREYLRKVLAKLTPEERKAYLVVDMFINSSASGGLSKSFDEFLLKRNKETADFIGYAWEEWYNEHVLASRFFDIVRDANSKIEQSSRLGLFLAMLDESGDVNKALRTVIETHFDYKLKEPGIELLEQFFWFSTFPINNLMYYMNYGLTRNPIMLKAQLDSSELSYNDQDNYTWDYVKASDYLTYNALTGNIRFYLLGNDKDDPTSRLILKTGSSVLDFFNIVVDPIGSGIERLNPFLAVALGLESFEQLNPLQSAVNRGKQIIEGTSYVPSVYATLYPKREYKPRHYIEKIPYYKRSWNISPKTYPRIRRFYTSNTYIRYPKHYYAYNQGVGYKWMKATRSIKPYFLHDISRVTSQMKKYRRQMKRLKMPGDYLQ